MIESAVAQKLQAAQWRTIKPDCVAPDDYVEQVEASIGATLPEQYRSFLSAWPCRSGPRRPVYCPILRGPGKNSGGAPLLEFSGFDPDSKTIMNMDGDYRKSAFDGFVLIADDLLSNWFYLKLADGSAWYLNRSGKGARNFENLALVGSDFNDFILRMRIP